MAQKVLFGFTNISVEILLHILGYNFCNEDHILVHFCQTLLPSKASKIKCTKAVLRWHQKCW